jgi:hypothetical protein
MKIEPMNFLSIKFDGDILFELPPICKPMRLSKQMQGMDRKVRWSHLVKGENNQH